MDRRTGPRLPDRAERELRKQRELEAKLSAEREARYARNRASYAEAEALAAEELEAARHVNDARIEELRRLPYIPHRYREDEFLARAAPIAPAPPPPEVSPMVAFLLTPGSPTPGEQPALPDAFTSELAIPLSLFWSFRPVDCASTAGALYVRAARVTLKLDIDAKPNVYCLTQGDLLECDIDHIAGRFDGPTRYFPAGDHTATWQIETPGVPATVVVVPFSVEPFAPPPPPPPMVTYWTCVNGACVQSTGPSIPVGSFATLAACQAACAPPPPPPPVYPGSVGTLFPAPGATLAAGVSGLTSTTVSANLSLPIQGCALSQIQAQWGGASLNLTVAGAHPSTAGDFFLVQNVNSPVLACAQGATVLIGIVFPNIVLGAGVNTLTLTVRDPRPPGAVLATTTWTVTVV